jgi:hypothetical protein
MNRHELLLASDFTVRQIQMGKSILVSAPDSFSWNIANGRITLFIPVQSKLEIYESGSWRLLHDGRKWTRYGASPGLQTLELGFDYPAKFRLQVAGKSFQMGPQNEKLLYSKGASARLNGREWRLLGTSVVLHVAVFASVLGFLSIPAVKQAIDASVREKQVEVKKPESKPTGSVGAARPPAVPFQGMGYAKFLNLLAAKEFAADPAAVLMKSIKKSTVELNAPKVANVGSSLGKVQGAVQSGDSSLSGQLKNEKFMAVDRPNSTTQKSKISDAELAELKAKFRDLQSDFQRLYSRLLVSDPSFSVTVSLELLVQPSGYLSVASFKARGSQRPESVEKLKRGMTEIIQNTFAGTQFVGISLRGENVFVR